MTAVGLGTCPCGGAPAPRQPGRGRDVVLAQAFETWADARAKEFAFSGERLVRQLLVDARVDRLLVADPYRSVLGLLRRHRTRAVGFPADDRTVLVSPRRLRRRESVSGAAVRRQYRAYDDLLHRRARRLGMREPVLVTCNPLHAAVAAGRWSRTVYYAWDDWTVHPITEPWWDLYRDSYRAIAEGGVVVAAVTEALRCAVAAQGPSLVVPNGVEPREWDAVPPPPEWLAALPAPRLLYAGTIGDRLDVRAVAQLAAAFPHGTVALVGSVVQQDAIAPLRGLPSLVVVPDQPRAAIRSVMAACDVGLVPHRDLPLTRAMSPLKLYEYLAAGLPAVSTDLPPSRGVHERVVLVPPGGDFRPAVAAALSGGRLGEADRSAVFAQHCWHRRFDRLLEAAL